MSTVCLNIRAAKGKRTRREREGITKKQTTNKTKIGEKIQIRTRNELMLFMIKINIVIDLRDKLEESTYGSVHGKVNLKN